MLTIESRSHSLLAGDEMVSINGEDVLEAESENEIMEVLIEASWPKTLRFRRRMAKKPIKTLEEIAEERAAKGTMFIEHPKILRGHKVMFMVAEFGTLRRATLRQQLEKEGDMSASPVGSTSFCSVVDNVVRIRPAQPLDGCQNVRPLFGNDATNTTTIMYAMVKRGGCAFTRKAEMVEKAGYDGIVVFNGDGANEQLMRMPAQRNFKTKEIVPIKFNGQGIMIDSLNGDLLLTAMLTAGVPLA